MTIEEMKKYLSQIQNNSFENKILNVILTCYAEIKEQQRAIVELQIKVNQIIKILNDKNNAETTNSEEDAPVNESAPRIPKEDK